MKYFAIRNDAGVIVSFGSTTANTVTHEITEAEYLTIKQESETVNGYVEAVYAGDMAFDDVPEEYRATVESRVAEMQEADVQPADPEISDSEALAIITGGADA